MNATGDRSIWDTELRAVCNFHRAKRSHFFPCPEQSHCLSFLVFLHRQRALGNAKSSLWSGSPPHVDWRLYSARRSWPGGRASESSSFHGHKCHRTLYNYKTTNALLMYALSHCKIEAPVLVVPFLSLFPAPFPPTSSSGKRSERKELRKCKKIASLKSQLGSEFNLEKERNSWATLQA